jgi:hypothetical protein
MGVGCADLHIRLILPPLVLWALETKLLWDFNLCPMFFCENQYKCLLSSERIRIVGHSSSENTAEKYLSLYVLLSTETPFFINFP